MGFYQAEAQGKLYVLWANKSLNLFNTSAIAFTEVYIKNILGSIAALMALRY